MVTLTVRSHVQGNPTGAQIQLAFDRHFSDAIVSLKISESARRSFNLEISGVELEDVRYAADLYLSPIQIGYELHDRV